MEVGEITKCLKKQRRGNHIAAKRVDKEQETKKIEKRSPTKGKIARDCAIENVGLPVWGCGWGASKVSTKPFSFPI